MLSLLAAFSSAQTTQKTPVVDERSILVEFYQATGGPSWNDNRGWEDLEGNYCDWHGVICTGEADLSLLGGNARNRQRHLQRTYLEEPEVNKVIGIELEDNFLQGRTPALLWKLPLLQYVNLKDNDGLQVDFSGLAATDSGSPPTSLSIIKISGTDTTSLTGIENAAMTVNHLDLTGCPFRSEFPGELFKLSNLRNLQLSKCQLQGTLSESLAALSNLRDLNLFDNDLTGTLPQNALTQLVRLEKFSVSRNRFTGNLRGMDGWSPNLIEVYLAENQFSGNVPVLANLAYLTKLYLNRNQLSGNIPAGFLQGTLQVDANFQDDAPLIEVDLSRNQLTGVVPSSLDALSELNLNFDLRENEFTGVATELCDNENWQRGDITRFECNGILCPPATYSPVGHANPEHNCEPCDSDAALYYGATTCVQEDDKSALIAFYQATNGANWKNNDGWKNAFENLDSDDSSPCDWFGVSCWTVSEEGALEGRVRSLHLYDNNLDGVIPAELFRMKYLHTLRIARNAKVTLPLSKIGSSTHIRYLDFSQTATNNFDGLDEASSTFAYLVADGLDLGGTLPSQILALEGLKLLSMSECKLIGTLPSELGLLTNLNELYLFDNEIHGSIPSTLGQIGGLRMLSLAQNQLTGTIPSSFNDLQKLEALSLTDQVNKGGGITGSLTPFGFHPSLVSIQLGYNRLTGSIPMQLLEGVSFLNNVLMVGLEHNQLTGTVPGELAKFPLMDLELRGNKLVAVDELLCQKSDWMGGNVGFFGCDAILCPVGTGVSGGRQRFEDAPCEKCPDTSALGGTSATWMGRASCYTEFQFEKTDEQELVELLFQQTKGSQWNNNRCWSAGEDDTGTPVHVCEWYGISCDETKSIVSITLGTNNLQGRFPTEIFMLPNLEQLSLFGNDELEVSLDGIENAENLRSLILDGTGLASLDGIGKARSLTELNVRNNKLKGTLSDELSRLINIESLDISKNAFEGPIPYWINNLPSLSTLLASNNNFNGPLPDFGNFGSLSVIDLSFNNLYGEIPSTFLKSLSGSDKVVVDLSNNRIDGSIPRELSRLSRLTIHLKDNAISEIDGELCSVDGWNDYDVERYGCDGILCPAGTSSPLGRQTSEASECLPCKGAKHMGSTACYTSSGTESLTVGIASIISLASSVFFLVAY